MNRILLCLLLGFTFQAKADTDLKSYVDYIVEVSSLSYEGQALPKIEAMAPNRLLGYAYTAEQLIESDQTGKPLPTVLGLYVPAKKTILVSADLDLSDKASSGPTLVHELVHYLQDINGVTQDYDGLLACTEGEAYDIQALWQLENKVRPDEYPVIQQQVLLSFMKCEHQAKKPKVSR